jgi:hypothetical protein
MGTTSEAPKAPENKITFVEDLDDAGAVAAVRRKGWLQQATPPHPSPPFSRPFSLPALNFSSPPEQLAAGPRQPGEHLLHECYRAVPSRRPGAQPGAYSAVCSPLLSLRCNVTYSVADRTPFLLTRSHSQGGGAGGATLAGPLNMLFQTLNTATDSNTLQTAVMLFLTVGGPAREQSAGLSLDVC